MQHNAKSLIKQSLHKLLNNVSVGKNMMLQGIMLLLLIAILIFTNSWAINIINNQLVESNQKMLNLYVNQMDEELYRIEKQMAKFMVDNTSRFRSMERQDKDSQYHAKKVDTMLRETFAGVNHISGAFVYNTQQDRFISYDVNDSFFTNGSKVGEWFKNQCKAYETADAADAADTADMKQWICRKVKDDYSLIRIMRFSHFYMGVYMKNDRLLSALDSEYRMSYERLIVKDGQGMLMSDSPYMIEGHDLLENSAIKIYTMPDGGKYTSIERKSSLSSLRLATFHKNTELLLGLQGMQLLVAILAGISILFMAGLIWHTRQNLILPINTLVSAMEEVKNGDLQTHIDTQAHYDEFQRVFERFNEMVSEIRVLKIDVYEKKINNQRTMLKFLRLQINPHFFLNSLNVIYSLALTQNVAVIKELVLRLTKHARYLMKIADGLVNLVDELGYIDNYIEIQNLRYSFKLQYNLTRDPATENCRIPQMLIYTFVENAVKYGLREEQEILRIDVDITEIDREGEPFLRIEISDNGPGFQDEQLIARLNAGEIIVDAKGEEHYGISNVKQRLDILYEERAEIIFSNSPSAGAVIEMRLPMKSA